MRFCVAFFCLVLSSPAFAEYLQNCDLYATQRAAATAGKESAAQAKMECLMAQQMQTQQQPQPQITTNPEFCAGIAMMKGQDPNQARLDCAMAQSLQANPGNADIQRQYNDYQQQRAIRQQQQTLDEINKKLNQPMNCTTTYDRWGAHTTCN